MNVLSANEAKTQFGDMILKVQQAPVQINKNGKPVAVVISIDEYEASEALKLQALQARATKARSDIESNNTVDGESFFEALTLDHHD